MTIKINPNQSIKIIPPNNKFLFDMQLRLRTANAPLVSTPAKDPVR
jgi:hypothetical protein